MRKIILFSGLVIILFTALCICQYIQFYDGKLHVVFCDVGQGDGIFIRTPEGKDILIDAGPDSSIESCLAGHMPFWDRDIELAILTHHHLDHYGGFVNLAKDYVITWFVAPDSEVNASVWKAIEKELADQKTTIKPVKKGDVIHIDSLKFVVLNPYDATLQEKEDMNDESIAGVLSYQNFDVLLTGDVLKEASDRFDPQIPHVEVLKVPHHGSRNGLTAAMLSAASPMLAVISDGKRNMFGHPHKETLVLLKNTKTLRTDLMGAIEIVSDGTSFWVKSE